MGLHSTRKIKQNPQTFSQTYQTTKREDQSKIINERGRTRGMGWRQRREGGSGWGTYLNPWLIHVNVCKNHYNIVK